MRVAGRRRSRGSRRRRARRGRGRARAPRARTSRRPRRGRSRRGPPRRAATRAAGPSRARVETTRIIAKPSMIPRTTVASTPPASRMSAVAEPDRAERVAERVRRGRAAGRDDVRGPAQSEAHRELRGDRADRARRDRVDGRLLDLVRVVEVVHPLGELDRPAAGSERSRRSARRSSSDSAAGIDPGVRQRLRGRRDRQRHGAGDVPHFLVVQVVRRLEALHLAGDRGGEPLGVEERDASDAALARARARGRRPRGRSRSGRDTRSR